MLLIVGALMTACGSSADPYSSEPLTQPRDQQCDFAPVEPTWLPWLEDDEPVPSGLQTYDETIDRAQESWQNPHASAGKAGVGLTLYTLHSAAEPGEPTGVTISGVEGELHESEGGDLVIVWDLPEDRCNFLELTFAPHGAFRDEAKSQVIRVAESLRPRD